MKERLLHVLGADGCLAKMLCSFSIKIRFSKNRNIKVIRLRRRRRKNRRGEPFLTWWKLTCFCIAFRVYFPYVTAQSYTKSCADHSGRNFSSCGTWSQNGDVALCVAVSEALVTQLKWKCIRFAPVCPRLQLEVRWMEIPVCGPRISRLEHLPLKIISAKNELQYTEAWKVEVAFLIMV